MTISIHTHMLLDIGTDIIDIYTHTGEASKVLLALIINIRQGRNTGKTTQHMNRIKIVAQVFYSHLKNEIKK